MTTETTTSWAMLMALGAFHGINPGMGWLFAVALGMQERRRGAVLRALVPLGAGHALAVAAAVGVALVIGAVIPSRLAALAAGRRSRLAWRHSILSSPAPPLGWHAREHGRAHRVVVPDGHGPRGRAHGGAGRPGHVDVRRGGTRAPHARHGGGAGAAFFATGLHALGYLAVTAVVAVVVFEKVGVGILRRAWFNLDLIWSGALVATGMLTLML